MDKKHLIARIRQSEPRLRALGLRSLALFGSWSRGEQRVGSDVDLLYEFEEGYATLDHRLALEEVLEEVLDHDVDLVPARHVSPILWPYISDSVEPILQPDLRAAS